MVKYYGRARQRIGSVNTNQIGLKMSGCPSKVGRKGTIDRYISQRVSCLRGVCGGSLVNGVLWNRKKISNNPPFCKVPSGKCLAAAGGIGNINTPYYKTNAPGTKGCGVPVTGVPPGGSAPRSILQRGVNGEILSARVPYPLPTSHRIGYEVTSVAATSNNRTIALAYVDEPSTMTGYSQVLDELGLKLTAIIIGAPAPAPAPFVPLNYIKFVFNSTDKTEAVINLFSDPKNPPFTYEIVLGTAPPNGPKVIPGVPGNASGGISIGTASGDPWCWQPGKKKKGICVELPMESIGYFPGQTPMDLSWAKQYCITFHKPSSRN